MMPVTGGRQVLPPQTSQLPWQQQGFPSLSASIHENVQKRQLEEGLEGDSLEKAAERILGTLLGVGREAPLRRFGGRRVCLGRCWEALIPSPVGSC